MEFKFFPDSKKDHPRVKNDEKEIKKARENKNPDKKKFTRRDFIITALTSGAAIAADLATKKPEEALAMIKESNKKKEFTPEKEWSEEPTPSQEKIKQANEEVIRESLQELNVTSKQKEDESFIKSAELESESENNTEEEMKVRELAKQLIEEENKGKTEELKELKPNKEKVTKEAAKKTPTLEKLLRLNNHDGTLNFQELQEKLHKKWLEKYGEGGKLRNDLERGYKNMQPWLEEMKKCFQEEGVPEKYVFICLPESHFDLKAVSKSKAVGPYQFTKSTATDDVCQLHVNDVVDERYDPIKSARAAARTLKHIYDFCGDWKLAIAGYNGNFIWDYFP